MEKGSCPLLSQLSWGGRYIDYQVLYAYHYLRYRLYIAYAAVGEMYNLSILLK